MARFIETPGPKRQTRSPRLQAARSAQGGGWLGLGPGAAKSIKILIPGCIEQCAEEGRHARFGSGRGATSNWAGPFLSKELKINTERVLLVKFPRARELSPPPSVLRIASTEEKTDSSSLTPIPRRRSNSPGGNTAPSRVHLRPPFHRTTTLGVLTDPPALGKAELVVGGCTSWTLSKGGAEF